MRLVPRTAFSPTRLLAAVALLTALGLANGAGARTAIQPVDATHDVAPVEAVNLFRADRVDAPSLFGEDVRRQRDGLPARFALPQDVFIAPDTHGTWEELPGSMMVWRLRISSLDAVSLNLGFTRYAMPAGGHMSLYPVDGSSEPVTFTAADNRDHGQLWTPILRTRDMMVEVVVPTKARWDLDLELTSLNVGYKEFGRLTPEPDLKQGLCNIDVVCSEGDDWRDDIQSVGAYSLGGSIFCTGTMINNTSNDETPYFLTADHCPFGELSAESMVVYWNYHSPECGDLTGGPLTMFQTGSTFLAKSVVSDFALVELDEIPDPDHMVAYAGWDRTGDAVDSATAIHHPSGDEKAISFENDPLDITTYLGNSTPGDGTHLRVFDWDVGTTEPGSSGSPLFDANHRIIGQLHGGWAACGNDESDWYGRFFKSWTGEGTPATRLSDWLDPTGTGAMTLDLIAPYASGMSVSAGDLDASGDPGGPFAPLSKVYTIRNRYDDISIDFTVSSDISWADLSSTSGTLAPGASTTVTVSLNPSTTSLANGIHRGTLTFLNTTDGDGDSERNVELIIGTPRVQYAWDMSTDPDWTAQGAWAYGAPAGAGGAYGNPDPAAGATGANVYGFGLDGDYAPNLPETHLTTAAVDCSALSVVSLKFMRHLNVEQSTYDHASVRVSIDGVAWTTVWENTTEITDDAWMLQQIDISEVADGQPSVYLRWTMGTTDGSWQYSGWNIDDVEIWGLEVVSGAPGDKPGDDETPTLVRLHSVTPNPFNPRAAIAFDLPRTAVARVAVYDVRGQLVRVLHDGTLPSGKHTVVWDGDDASGRPQGSGSYLFRLETGRETQTRKAVLVR